MSFAMPSPYALARLALADDASSDLLDQREDLSPLQDLQVREKQKFYYNRQFQIWEMLSYYPAGDLRDVAAQLGVGFLSVEVLATSSRTDDDRLLAEQLGVIRRVILSSLLAVTAAADNTVSCCGISRDIKSIVRTC